MRAGDMVMQSEFIAHWAKDRSVAFVGDGDAISVAVANLRAAGILDYGPSKVKVFDFDERIVNSIQSFAAERDIDWLSARLYNCLEPIPDEEEFDCFYSNPPWGASNGGQSVNVFAQRGMELIHHQGDGVLVIADGDPLRPWTETVLANVQRFAVSQGFYVSRMMPKLHSYHLDDDPDLLSCNLILRSQPANESTEQSRSIRSLERLDNFYKQGGGTPTVRFVRDPLSKPPEPVFEYYEEGALDD
jgi:hypothetical protein